MTFDVYLRFVQKQASPAEAHAVRAWLANPAHAALAQQWMQRYADLLEQEEGAAEEMPDFEKIQLELLARLALTPARPPKRQQARWPQWAAAAVLLGGLLAGGVGLWRASPAGPALTTVHTAFGELRTVRLPDGSTVQLNGNSTLRYAPGLNQPGPREVWLDGEGYFAVQHLPDHRRFLVHTTAGFKVEVLGTRFTVYRRRAQARVVLLSGKVRVDFANQRRSKEVVLKPGELLETNDNQPTIIEHIAVKTAPYVAWKDHQLVFDETSLADVATRLGDTYGVAVRIESPALAWYKITGTFPVGDLEAVLQFLEKSFPLTVRRQPNQILLFDNSPSNSQ